MVEGHRLDHWSRMSSLLALLANVHRDPHRRSRPYRAEDFNPMVKHGSNRHVISRDVWRQQVRKIFENMNK